MQQSTRQWCHGTRSKTQIQAREVKVGGGRGCSVVSSRVASRVNVVFHLPVDPLVYDSIIQDTLLPDWRGHLKSICETSTPCRKLPRDCKHSRIASSPRPPRISRPFQAEQLRRRSSVGTDCFKHTSQGWRAKARQWRMTFSQSMCSTTALRAVVADAGSMRLVARGPRTTRRAFARETKNELLQFPDRAVDGKQFRFEKSSFVADAAPNSHRGLEVRAHLICGTLVRSAPPGMVENMHHVADVGGRRTDQLRSHIARWLLLLDVDVRWCARGAVRFYFC